MKVILLQAIIILTLFDVQGTIWQGSTHLPEC